MTRDALDQATFDLAVISEIMVTLAEYAQDSTNMLPARWARFFASRINTVVDLLSD